MTQGAKGGLAKRRAQSATGGADNAEHPVPSPESPDDGRGRLERSALVIALEKALAGLRHQEHLLKQHGPLQYIQQCIGQMADALYDSCQHEWKNMRESGMYGETYRTCRRCERDERRNHHSSQATLPEGCGCSSNTNNARAHTTSYRE